MNPDHLDLAPRLVGHWLLGHDLEGKALQAVADQQSGGFVEFQMHRGLAPPQHIVVHAGQIIVHQ